MHSFNQRYIFLILLPLTLVLFLFQNCTSFESSYIGDASENSLNDGNNLPGGNTNEPPVDAPTCELSASKMEINKGESIQLYLTAEGLVDTAKIEDQDLNLNLDNTVTVTPTESGVFTATVGNRGGTNTCTSETVMVLEPVVTDKVKCNLASSPAEFIPGELVTVSMTTEGEATAITFLEMDEDKMNSSFMKDINIDQPTVVKGTITDVDGKTAICQLTVSPKIDLTEIEFFQSKFDGRSVNDLITRQDQCVQCHTSGTPKDPKFDKAPLKFMLGDNALTNLAAIKSFTRSDPDITEKGDLTSESCQLANISSGNHQKNERGTYTAADIALFKQFCDNY